MNRHKHDNDIHGPGSLASEKHGIFPPHRRRMPLSPMMSHVVAAVAEFVGTFMFLFLAYAGHLMAFSRATDAASGGGQSAQTVLVIGLAYAISLLVNVWAFYRISGGLFNPAVSISPAHSSPSGPSLSNRLTCVTTTGNPRSRPHRPCPLDPRGDPRTDPAAR